ncbi:unnamed protein product [Prunus armeniaca]
MELTPVVEQKIGPKSEFEPEVGFQSEFEQEIVPELKSNLVMKVVLRVGAEYH